jgi:cephalosporin-C deacetylase-like acetyl esterase
MRALLIAGLLLVAGVVRAGDDLTVLPRADKSTSRTMLRAYLLAQAQKHFDARRAAVAKIDQPEQVQARQKTLRARFIESLGGWPARTPLKARVVGKVTGKGYTIEKVIYESRPGHHVTASFYLPDGKGPFPAVLMPIGHSNPGKAADYVQRGCILLAKNGIAALAYDPIGQGERRQLLDQEGKPAVPGSTTEHTLVGVGALLVGWNTATYRIWDGIRSLDYLASRPEVDARRLGCTGCSGGGTLTSYLMALDDRIVAAAPSCYITSLERLFATIGPQDAEQNITGQVAFGMEHADYITLRAPRPTLILASTRDFFDIQGTWTSFREAKRVYTLLGHPERLDIIEVNAGHGYPRSHREAMLRWMQRWLAGKDEAAMEDDFPIHKEAELRCTRTGQVLEDLKGVSTFQLTARRARELKAERARRQADLGTAGLGKTVAARLGVVLPVKAATMRELGTLTRDTCTIRKVIFDTEPGIQVPGLLFEPAKPVKVPLVLYIHGEGKAVDAGMGGPIERRVKAGQRVLAVDLRGLGETAPAPTSKRPGYFGEDVREAFLALHIDRPLLGQRVGDLLAVLGKVAGDSEVEGVGIGKGGPVVLHAAALDRRIAKIRLERSLTSWTAVAETPLGRDQLTQVVPGALALYDLPDLAAGLAPRPLTIHAATDPTRRAVPKEAVEEVYAPVTRAYESAKASEKLTIEAGEETKK